MKSALLLLFVTAIASFSASAQSTVDRLPDSCVQKKEIDVQVVSRPVLYSDLDEGICAYRSVVWYMPASEVAQLCIDAVLKHVENPDYNRLDCKRRSVGLVNVETYVGGMICSKPSSKYTTVFYYAHYELSASEFKTEQCNRLTACIPSLSGEEFKIAEKIQKNMNCAK